MKNETLGNSSYFEGKAKNEQESANVLARVTTGVRIGSPFIDKLVKIYGNTSASPDAAGKRAATSREVEAAIQKSKQRKPNS